MWSASVTTPAPVSNAQADGDEIFALHGAGHDGNVGRVGVDQTREALHGAVARILPRTDALRIALSRLRVGGSGPMRPRDRTGACTRRRDTLRSRGKLAGSGSVPGDGAALAPATTGGGSKSPIAAYE